MINWSLPTLIDRRLMAYDFIYGGSGDPFYTLKIAPKALLALNMEPRLADIPCLSERT